MGGEKAGAQGWAVGGSMRNRKSHRMRWSPLVVLKGAHVSPSSAQRRHTDFEHSRREVAGDKGVSTLTRNLLGSEGVLGMEGGRTKP